MNVWWVSCEFSCFQFPKLFNFHWVMTTCWQCFSIDLIQRNDIHFKMFFKLWSICLLPFSGPVGHLYKKPLSTLYNFDNIDFMNCVKNLDWRFVRPELKLCTDFIWCSTVMVMVWVGILEEKQGLLGSFVRLCFI